MRYLIICLSETPAHQSILCNAATFVCLGQIKIEMKGIALQRRWGVLQALWKYKASTFMLRFTECLHL